MNHSHEQRYVANLCNTSSEGCAHHLLPAFCRLVTWLKHRPPPELSCLSSSKLFEAYPNP
eukprot:1047867-Amphidinium_carterae.1